VRLSNLIMPRGLQYADGLGELVGPAGAAAGVYGESSRVMSWAFGCSPGKRIPGVSSVGLFLGCRLVLPEIRDLRVATSR
jgi:hypothetical protein